MAVREFRIRPRDAPGVERGGGGKHRGKGETKGGRGGGSFPYPKRGGEKGILSEKGVGQKRGLKSVVDTQKKRSPTKEEGLAKELRCSRSWGWPKIPKK